MGVTFTYVKQSNSGKKKGEPLSYREEMGAARGDSYLLPKHFLTRNE